MTTDDILRMAREAGFQDRDGTIRTLHSSGAWVGINEELERFAALVAASEREECAKVCEEVSGRPTLYGTLEGRARAIGLEQGATRCADAIRARGKT